MRCETCDVEFTPGRLFCTNCGAVSPEGLAVMTNGTEGSAALVPSTAVGVRGFRATPTSSTAVMSLIFGILGYVAIPLVGALVAVVTGHAARKEIRVSGGRLDGQLLANVGLALGYSQFVLAGLVFVAVFGLGALAIVSG